MSDEPRDTFLGAAANDQGDVVVLGVPYAHGSSQTNGTALAPATLRALARGERIESGIWSYRDRSLVVQRLRVGDVGDFSYGAARERRAYLASLEDTAFALAERGSIPLALGGDHSIALPLAGGVARAVGRAQVVQIDAHHDYSLAADDALPTPTNFVNFLARVSAVDRVIQIGVRGYSSMLPERPAGVIEATVEGLADALEPGLPTYLTIDTDGFDPAIAPAVAHPEPDGLGWRDLDRILSIIGEKRCSLVGVDWTEYDPEFEGRNCPTGRAIVSALVRILGAIERQRYEG